MREGLQLAPRVQQMKKSRVEEEDVFGGMSNVESVDEEKVHTMMRGRMKCSTLEKRL